MKKILIYGDSHTKGFIGYKNDKVILDINSIPGASIKGLPRHKSTLNLNEKIKIKLENNYDLVIFKFGQVDIDLGFWYTKIYKNNNIKFDEYIKILINMYKNFIKSLKIKKLIIFGINLPSIFNKENCINFTYKIIKKKTCNKKILQKIIPDIYKRTNNTLLFNSSLKELAKELNIHYYDNIKISLNKNILNELYHDEYDIDHHPKGISLTVHNYNEKIIKFCRGKLYYDILDIIIQEIFSL